MERLTVKRKDGRCALANSADASNLSMMDKIPLAIDRLAAYEDAEEAEILVRVVRCDGCVYHVDNGYHYCKKLRIDCPLSDFYCEYGKAAIKEG